MPSRERPVLHNVAGGPENALSVERARHIVVRAMSEEVADSGAWSPVKRLVSRLIRALKSMLRVVLITDRVSSQIVPIFSNQFITYDVGHGKAVADAGL